MALFFHISSTCFFIKRPDILSASYLSFRWIIHAAQECEKQCNIPLLWGEKNNNNKKKNSPVQLFALYKSQRGFKYTGCKQQTETHISEGAVLFRLDCTLLSRLQDITSATWVQDWKIFMRRRIIWLRSPCVHSGYHKRNKSHLFYT